MGGLEHVRVLVVEDEALLLLELLDILADLGAQVVGSAARVEQALELARTASYNLAIFDVNLGTERIDPVAKVIAGRRIPIVFATGYASQSMPPAVTAEIVTKPYDANSLRPAIVRVLAENSA